MTLEQSGGSTNQNEEHSINWNKEFEMHLQLIIMTSKGKVFHVAEFCAKFWGP
jgi:hypothetical protein